MDELTIKLPAMRGVPIMQIVDGFKSESRVQMMEQEQRLLAALMKAIRTSHHPTGPSPAFPEQDAVSGAPAVTLSEGEGGTVAPAPGPPAVPAAFEAAIIDRASDALSEAMPPERSGLASSESEPQDGNQPPSGHPDAL